MALHKPLINWGIFIALSFIWGSSFILMKVGLQSLNEYQVAALRLFSAGVVLIPSAFTQIRKVPTQKFPLIILSGLTGSFIPAFLFCIAETKISSSLTGIINALTPICTIIIGVLFFKSPIHWRKTSGALIGFGGLCLLFFGQVKSGPGYFSYAALILLATICYGINVNLVSRYLGGIGSLNIAAVAFSFLTIPAFTILYFTGFFHLPLTDHAYMVSTAAGIVLGVFGTAVASIIFYMLVKRAGVLFPSMVTYAIPFVAILWGFLYHEKISMIEIVCLVIILAGVFLTHD